MQNVVIEKWILRQVFICLRPPPLLGFCLGCPKNCVGPESGQIKSVKEYGLQKDPTPPTPSQLHLHRVGGGGEPERRLEGQ
jgi:hypothetical protein